MNNTTLKVNCQHLKRINLTNYVVYYSLLAYNNQHEGGYIMKEGKKTVESQRSILSKNIEKLLDSKGKTQTDMARELDFPEATVSSWMNCERYPRIARIQKMADYFGVYRSDITDDRNENRNTFTSSEYHYLPTTISAGLPITVDAITEAEKISLPDNLMGKWSGHQDIFISKVNGDSMNKTMPDRSLIAIKPMSLENLKDGDIVVYSVDHEYSVKRLIKQADRLVFRPHSTDLTFTDDIVNIENKDLLIHGKVVLYIVEMD